MTGIRWHAAILASMLFAAEASAQVIPLTPPLLGVPMVLPSGVNFWYQSKRLGVAGFVPIGPGTPVVMPVNPFTPIPTIVGPPLYPAYYGYYYAGFPYGLAESRTTVQIINPPALAAPPLLSSRGRPRLRPGEQLADVSGIDLDVETSDKIWGKKPGVKIAPAKEKEDAKVERKEEPKPAKIPVAPPKVDPAVEMERLLDNGINAFRDGEYGIAILRFRALADADVPLPRAMFLQGQAYIAVGRYRDAARLLQQGLKRQPDWPRSDFRPKVELFKNDAELWKQNVDRLEQAQRLEPKNADLAFLLGYMSWFGGDRDAAVDHFRRARALAEDPAWADLFLKAVK